MWAVFPGTQEEECKLSSYSHRTLAFGKLIGDVRFNEMFDLSHILSGYL